MLQMSTQRADLPVAWFVAPLFCLVSRVTVMFLLIEEFVETHISTSAVDSLTSTLLVGLMKKLGTIV